MSCPACDLAAGTLDPPGGLIHATEHWLVEHCIGPLGVGTLVVKPKRHVVRGHIHFVVQPVTRAQRERHGGGVRVQAGMFDAKVPPPRDDVEVFADSARALFAA